MGKLKSKKSATTTKTTNEALVCPLPSKCQETPKTPPPQPQKTTLIPRPPPPAQPPSLPQKVSRPPPPPPQKPFLLSSRPLQPPTKPPRSPSPHPIKQAVPDNSDDEEEEEEESDAEEDELVNFLPQKRTANVVNDFLGGERRNIGAPQR